MYSTDGINNWTSAAVPLEQWFSVTYGGGYFVAVAQGGTTDRVMYSTDGINWTGIPAQPGAWSEVGYGNNKFIAVAASSSSPFLMSAFL